MKRILLLGLVVCLCLVIGACNSLPKKPTLIDAGRAALLDQFNQAKAQTLKDIDDLNKQIAANEAANAGKLILPDQYVKVKAELQGKVEQDQANLKYYEMRIDQIRNAPAPEQPAAK